MKMEIQIKLDLQTNETYTHRCIHICKYRLQIHIKREEIEDLQIENADLGEMNIVCVVCIGVCILIYLYNNRNYIVKLLLRTRRLDVCCNDTGVGQ